MDRIAPKQKLWGNAVKWKLGGHRCRVTEKMEPVDEQEETDFTSIEEDADGDEVIQYGRRKRGAKITVMIPAEGEEPDPVGQMLRIAAEDNDTKRVGPFEIDAPPECAMTIPCCSVRRTGWTGDKKAPLTVSYELKASTGEPNVNIEPPAEPEG